MAGDARKSFVLRMDPDTLDALRHWADDDLRSLNGQIEYLLRRALRETGRLRSPDQSRPEIPAQQNEATSPPAEVNEAEQE